MGCPQKVMLVKILSGILTEVNRSAIFLGSDIVYKVTAV
jgi:hypothetical protein